MAISQPFKIASFSVCLSMTLLITSCGNQSTANTDTNKQLDSAKVAPIMNREQQIEFSKKDLANHLKVELDTVKLSGSGTVTWKSGALGCPKPETQYTQALAPGVLIMLKIGNTPYRYHATPTGIPFHCPDDQAESPSYTASDI